MVAIYVQKTVHEGLWSRRIALFFVQLLILTVLLHRFGTLTTPAALNLMAVLNPGAESVMIDGALSLTVDGVRHMLRPGDCLRYRLQGREHLVERIGRVGIVHHHQGRIDSTVHHLHAAWHCRQCRTGVHCIAQAVAQGTQAANHTQHIADVVVTHQMGIQVMALSAFDFGGFPLLPQSACGKRGSLDRPKPVTPETRADPSTKMSRAPDRHLWIDRLLQ